MQNLCRLTLVQYAELSNIHFRLQNTDKPSPLPTKNTNQNNVTPKEAPPKRIYFHHKIWEEIYSSKSKNCWRLVFPAQLLQWRINLADKLPGNFDWMNQSLQGSHCV